MVTKNIQSRVIHKHDIETNWIKAVNFIPERGEIIVYDIDDNYTYERFKIGDGIQNVNDLPFLNVVQSDWNQNDSTQPDYVKNRTHWVEGTGATIEWDGNTEGRDSFIIEDTGVTYYKVNDMTPSKNELLGGTMTAFISGNSTEYILNDEGYMFVEGDNYLVVADLVFVVSEANLIVGGVPVSIPSTGVYFGMADGLGYATKLTYGSTTYHPLDEAFIPDTIARKSDIPEINYPVTSVNGMTGDVVIEASNNLFWTEEEATVLYSGADLDFADIMIQLEADFSFIEGNIYTLTIDGVSNTYTATSNGMITYIGDMSNGPLAYTMDGMLAIGIKDGGIHDVEISGLKQTYHFDASFAKGAQSDWEENDVDSINYIKNRPFYKELQTQGIGVIPSVTRKYTPWPDRDGVYRTIATMIAEPIIGENYYVHAGDSTSDYYECKSYLGMKHLGNLSLMNLDYEDTGESILVVFNDNNGTCEIYVTTPYDVGDSFITGSILEYSTIDNRYISSFVPKVYSAEKGQIITATGVSGNEVEWEAIYPPCWLEEGYLLTEEPITIEFTNVNDARDVVDYERNEDSELNNFAESFEFRNNSTYTIAFNGKYYPVVCKSSSFNYYYPIDAGGSYYIQGVSYFLGNIDLININDRYGEAAEGDLIWEYRTIPTNDYPDLPFCLVKYDHGTNLSDGNTLKFITCDATAQGTEPFTTDIEIYYGIHKYHQLDEKFIPNTIARVSDIPEVPEINYPVTSVNGQTGDVQIEIPSTEGLASEEYVNSAITNINTYYTKTEIDNMEFITLDEIDAICARTIEVVTPTTGTF